MVESEEVLGKIAAYETDNYAVRLCDIYHGEGYGERVEGCVFAFAGNLERLRTVKEYERERRAFEELEPMGESEETEQSGESASV